MPLFDQYVTIACVCEPGRRQPRRQRPLDGRGPARRARHGRRAARCRARSWAARSTASRRLPDGVGDGSGAPADDRPGHERRAPAGRSRLPGAPHHPRACTATSAPRSGSARSSSRRWRLRRLLGPAAGGPRRRPSSRSRASTCRASAARSRRVAVTIAGVAWAPDRGISAVEVSRRRGPTGRPPRCRCRSTTRPGSSGMLPWDATRPASIEIRVRATDGDGVVQTDERHGTGTRRRARPSHDLGRGRLTPTAPRSPGARGRCQPSSSDALDHGDRVAGDPDGAVLVLADVGLARCARAASPGRRRTGLATRPLPTSH